jgi:hypothetical protein
MISDRALGLAVERAILTAGQAAALRAIALTTRLCTCAAPSSVFFLPTSLAGFPMPWLDLPHD